MSRQNKIIARESTRSRLIEQSRVRLLCVGLFFLLCFGSISARMIDVAVLHRHAGATITVADPDNENKTVQVELQSTEPVLQRGDIVDRNGTLVATSLMTASVFVNPKELRDPQDAANKLARALNLDAGLLLSRFKSGKTFLWIKRYLPPKEEQRVNALGIPGLYFLPEEKRVYPYGNLLAHALGYVGMDNHGQAGMEKEFDARLRDPAANREPFAISIDVRLQGMMHEEMEKAVDEFQAIGATGIILDLHSGELLSMVSLPDFDPNRMRKSDNPARFNRASQGVYEMGSTFKSFTMALALENRTATMKSSYDATAPLKIANFTIHDDEPKHRWLSVPEIFTYSSNIGAARMALEVGGQKQRAFLEKLGMMRPVDIELPERSATLYPSDWKEINTVTISYGHGMSVSPLHLVRGIAAMVDGGILPRLTLVKDGNKNRAMTERVISEKTSENVRRLMRLVVEHGTGKNANVPGYHVAGKTGTAEKVSGGVYEKNAKLTSFISIFPMDDPRYLVLVMVDSPKGDAATHGFATGGWIAAPVVGRVIARMGPLLGMPPHYDAPGDDAEQFWVDNEHGNDKKAMSQPTASPAVEKRYVHAAAY